MFAIWKILLPLQKKYFPSLCNILQKQRQI